MSGAGRERPEERGFGDARERGAEGFDEEYLWSGRGAPDAETLRLERLLGTQRYRPPRRVLRSAPARVALAAAAALLVAWGATLAWRAGATAYAVEGLAGVARVQPGDELVTDAATEAWLEVADLGGVTVRPGSRLRVDRGRGGEGGRHRFYLERGSIRAEILAQPRVFQVGTPAGLTVDLGCEYDLDVDDAGVAYLAVRTGRVAFETAGRKVLVPARAVCTAHPERGPDTPVFTDAEPEFVAALRAVERDPRPRPADVEALIAAARREDSLSLWHLLDAPSQELRSAVHAKLAQLAPAPAEASDEALRAGDPALREAWRRALESDWRWY